MAERLLLDSNIVIGILNNSLSSENLTSAEDIFISAVTVMELYALAGISAGEERVIDRFIAAIGILPVSTAVARQAGTLARTRRQGKPDLLIAATALVYDLTLLTRNIKDFKNVAGLKIKSV
ncbi:MAG: type II toxin-antitoxin system VapC family toxin [Candidatus Magasanikbacteria bacterium]|nr:type II toxin-antitoxin system VapC family toxin [Candidatus Magasanikbacteria bacterium]